MFFKLEILESCSHSERSSDRTCHTIEKDLVSSATPFYLQFLLYMYS
ncbi:hypothetical protein ISN44_As01g052030, partial [Arabidopsis suecica]